MDTDVSVFPLFLLRYLKIINDFFYEILIWIKIKNIVNVCYFQVITNQHNQ